jgi:hypothetical protein
MRHQVDHDADCMRYYMISRAEIESHFMIMAGAPEEEHLHPFMQAKIESEKKSQFEDKYGSLEYYDQSIGLADVGTGYDFVDNINEGNTMEFNGLT